MGPLIANAVPFRWRMMPPKYGKRRSFNGVSRNGRRSLVLKIICEKICIRVAHDNFLLDLPLFCRPSGALTHGGARSHGLRRGLHSYAATRLTATATAAVTVAVAADECEGCEAEESHCARSESSREDETS